MSTQSFIGKDGFTWWVGQVEKNDGDPAGLGRVKVRIAGWYTGENYKQNIPTAMLPWAHVMQPTTEVGIKNVGKSNNRLGVGAIVMGFFLDGEEAQQPVVLGILRSFINTGTDSVDKVLAGEWIADIAESGGGFPSVKTHEIDHNKPLGQAATKPTKTTSSGGSRVNSNASAANGAQNNNPGRNDSGSGPQDTGPAGAGGTQLPASAANPSGVPSTCPRPVSNGLSKDRFQNYVDTLKYMLCDLGVTLGMVGKNEKGEFFSVVTGKLVSIDQAIVKIKRFISYAFNGLFAELKAGIANLIGDAVTQIMNEFAQLPFVYQLLIDTAIRIVNRFMCDFEIGNNFEEAINNAAAFVESFANSIIDQVVTIITDYISTALLTVENIVGRVQGALGSAIQLAGRIAQAIKTAKDASEAAKAVAETAEFWSTQQGKNLITNILNFIIDLLLDILFPDPCNRKTGDDRVKNWLPLYGTSECGGSELIGYEQSGNNPYQRPNAPWAPALLNSAETFLENFADGSFFQSSAVPGKKFARKVDHAGNSKVTDNKGNTHEHKGSNETKIVEGDKVTHIKSNGVLEVDGDFHLMVHGDFKLSVDGTTHTFTSSGPEVDKKGNVKDKGRARKVSQTFAGDYSIEYKGSYEVGANKISLHAAEGIDIKAQKGRVYMQGAGIVGSSAAASWSHGVETNFISGSQYNIIGLSPLGATGINQIAGQYNNIFGKRITTFINAINTMDITNHLSPSSICTYSQGSGAIWSVNHGTGGAMNFVGGAGTAFTVNVVGALSLASGGVLSISTVGKMFLTSIGPCTISATGPLTLLGVPIMLN